MDPQIIVLALFGVLSLIGWTNNRIRRAILEDENANLRLLHALCVAEKIKSNAELRLITQIIERMPPQEAKEQLQILLKSETS